MQSNICLDSLHIVAMIVDALFDVACKKALLNKNTYIQFELNGAESCLVIELHTDDKEGK